MMLRSRCHLQRLLWVYGPSSRWIRYKAQGYTRLTITSISLLNSLENYLVVAPVCVISYICEKLVCLQRLFTS